MYKIALIEDTPEIMEMIQTYLSRRKDFQIDTYINAYSALDDLKRKDYDIIVSDIIMDQMDGIEMLRTIKSFKPDQKVILMTSFSTEEKMITSDKLHATDYITKPFISLRDLENKILDNL